MSSLATGYLSSSFVATSRLLSLKNDNLHCMHSGNPLIRTPTGDENLAVLSEPILSQDLTEISQLHL